MWKTFDISNIISDNICRHKKEDIIDEILKCKICYKYEKNGNWCKYCGFICTKCL